MVDIRELDLGDSEFRPYLRYHPKASEDGSRPARSWMWGKSDMVEVTDRPAKGFIIDLENLIAGAEAKSTPQKGQAPHRVWASSPTAHDIPDLGPGAKSCFKVPVAFDKDTAGLFEGNSFASFKALRNLRQVIAKDPSYQPDDGRVPYVRCTGFLTVRTQNGATSVPILTFVQWVPRPAILQTAATAGAPIADDAEVVDDAAAAAAAFESPPDFDAAGGPPLLDDRIPFLDDDVPTQTAAATPVTKAATPDAAQAPSATETPASDPPAPPKTGAARAREVLQAKMAEQAVETKSPAKSPVEEDAAADDLGSFGPGLTAGAPPAATLPKRQGKATSTARKGA